MDERVPLEGPATHAHHIEIDALAQTKEGRRQLRLWSDVNDDAHVPTVEIGEIKPSRVIPTQNPGWTTPSVVQHSSLMSSILPVGNNSQRNEI